MEDKNKEQPKPKNDEDKKENSDEDDFDIEEIGKVSDSLNKMKLDDSHKVSKEGEPKEGDSKASDTGKHF